MDDRELSPARSMPDIVDRPVRTARTFVHHYNSTQYCNTETVFSMFPFLQTNITSQMWPRGDKGRSDIKISLLKHVSTMAEAMTSDQFPHCTCTDTQQRLICSFVGRHK